MIIRPATHADVEAAARIYDNAREFMRKNGNPDQWQGEYPGGYDVEIGIENGTSYVCDDGGEIVATFYFEMNADDPSYRRIYEGSWLSDAPYAVIHRIAVKYHGRGIADFCFNECFKLFPNVRIDTHERNIPMQKCLTRNGFEYCGVIYIEGLGTEGKRRAYQRKS
nr:GNAT family N-acetyltransferase [Oscillospiraceae bacterium]